METETNAEFMRRMEEKLEKTRIFLAFQVDSNDFVHLFNLAKRVQDYEDALKFYADDDKWIEINTGSPWNPYYEREIHKDYGEVAQQALNKYK